MEAGTAVRVVRVGSTTGLMINHRFLDPRRVGATGVVHGYVSGHGGDVVWVKYDDGTETAHCTDELESLRPEQRLPSHE